MTKNRSLFEYSDKMTKISAIGDPLERLNNNIPWENIFKPILEQLNSQNEEKNKNIGGRPRYNEILMLKILILQRAYNLSDEQAEYQINDRLSFQRFLGLDLSCDIPDYSTIWNFREALSKKGLVGKLFDGFNRYLQDQGLIMNNGSIIDASFVDVPKQRNTREENKQIKNDRTPDNWSEKKCSHKDTDARWTTKNKEVHYGYKNHVKVDIHSKLITKFTTTAASIHDSQEIKNLVDKKDKNKKLYADSAYRSEEIERLLKENQIISMIHEKGYRNKPLTAKQKLANKRKSKKRVRVEHVFGFVENSMHGSVMRCIGKIRGHAVIGLMNLTYNLFRCAQLQRA
jgi:IS5 family transposase